MGQQILVATTNDGKIGATQFQIADIGRPLTAVGQTCDRGNFVGFYADGGFIQNLESGETTWFSREDGLYYMDLWYKSEELGFQRPG